MKLTIPLYTLIAFIACMIFFGSCGGGVQKKGPEPVRGSAVPPKDAMLAVLEKRIDSIFSTGSAGQDSTVAYLIIPNTGCNGCISSAEQLLASFIKNRYPVRFVLTNIISYKLLRLKLGDSIALNKRVYLDKENIIYRDISGIKESYPMIIYTDRKDHHFRKFEYLEPDNQASVSHVYSYLSAR